MEFKDFTAGQNDDGRRLDKIVKNILPEANLSEIYKAIRKGLIKVNKKKSKAENHISSGDLISIADFLCKIDEDKEVKNDKTGDKNYKLPPLPPVVFENEDLIILNKPYNMVVHGKEDSLEKIVKKYWEEKKSADSLSFKPGPLHRIDKKTSGLTVFSKSLKGAQWFSKNIQDHSINKNYFAILQGHISSSCDFVDQIINNGDKDIGFYKVSASSSSLSNLDKSKNGASKDKTAISHIKVIARGKYKETPVTFVKINIETGRKHQIRAQSAFHGHPLLGDTTYGGSSLKNEKQDFYLQASELIFQKNPLNLPSCIKIDLSDAFKEMLNHCGINNYDV